MPDEPLDPPIWGVGRWGHFMWQPSTPTQPTPPVPSFSIKTKRPKPMNDPLQNTFNMIGTCVTFADGEDNLPIWQDKDPLDLTTDMATLHTLHAAAAATASQLAGATTGVAAGKDAFETVLEDRAFLLTRATFNHCRKTGDATTAAKVNYTKPALQRLRDLDLLATARNILAAAQAKSQETNATKRGITPAAITALSDAIRDYAAVINAPRSTIVTRVAPPRTHHAGRRLRGAGPKHGRPRHPAHRRRCPRVHRRLEASPPSRGHGPCEDETNTPTGTPPTA